MRNLKQRLWKAIAIASGILMWLGSANPAWAAGSISLSPAGGSGSQFTVQVMVNTGSDSSIEADVILTFNPQILQVTNVTYGQIYPENIHTIDNSTGRLSIFSYFSGTAPGDSFTGSGAMATIQFTGQQAGSAPVTITCTPAATNDSNIIKQGTSTDILDCQQVVNGSYTVTGTGEETETTTSPSPSATPTTRLSPTVTGTRTPTPTQILEVGGADDTSPTPTPVGELLTSGSTSATLTLTMVGTMLLLGSLFLFIW